MHAIALSNAFPCSTAPNRNCLTLAALGLIATLLNSPQVGAFTVSYDFESVSVPAATDSTDVCQPTCPTTVAAGLPDGDDGIRASSGGSAARVNVRTELNGINAVDAAAPDTVFDGFFSTGTTVAPNRFLVLGDNDGAVHGTSTVTPGTGQSFVRLPFFLPLATAAVSFSFDAVFEGIDSSATLQDLFTVKLSSATGTVSPMTIYQRGSDEGFVTLTLSGAQLPTWVPDPADTGRTWWLEFELLELGDGTQSAVGLDNVTISSVPLPAPLALLGSALVAMATTGRRERPR